MSADSHSVYALRERATPAVPAERDVGIVQHVDTVCREIRLRLSTGAAVVDVPLDCPIMLRGERVKLRMLQAGDQVRVTYARRRGLLIGKLLEVDPQSECPAICS